MSYSAEEINFLNTAKKIIEEIPAKYSEYEIINALNYPEEFSKKETMSYKEVIDKFGLSKLPYEKETTNVAVLTGNIFINDHLTSTWIIDQVKEIGRNGYMTLIDGDVVINGELIDDEISMLFITGSIKCKSIYSNDGYITIGKDGDICYGIYGYYNDGSIDIYGKTNTPFILSNDHQIFAICDQDTIYIEHFCDERKNLEFSNYKDKSYYEIDDPGKLFKNEIWDNEGNFDRDKFFNMISDRINPFIEI